MFIIISFISMPSTGFPEKPRFELSMILLQIGGNFFESLSRVKMVSQIYGASYARQQKHLHVPGQI